MSFEKKHKVIIAAIGSRGDVQPYIAFGLYLSKRGHSVVIATEERISDLVRSFGLEYKKIVGDSCGLLFEDEARKVIEKGQLTKLIKLTKEWESKFDKAEILQSYVSACAGADVIVSSGLSMTQTFSVSEYLRCAWIPLILGPTLATSEFPVWVLSDLICCRCLNKWSYNILFTMMWKSEKDSINTWRTEKLSLQPLINKRGIAAIIDTLAPPILIACSVIACGPKGRIPSDYPANACVGGFLFVPQTSETDVDLRLVEFLKSSEQNTSPSQRPVIYIGFGSMPTNSTLLVDIALDACDSLACRVVLIGSWSQFGEPQNYPKRLSDAILAKDVFVGQAAPHDWLFPKMACIVHHCGIGTTAAGFRAGVPQIPCPVMLDQPHNAKLIIKMGCAPTSIPFQKLTSKKLIAALSQVFANDSKFQGNARIVSEQINAENSSTADKFCAILEQYVGKFQAKRSL